MAQGGAKKNTKKAGGRTTPKGTKPDLDGIPPRRSAAEMLARKKPLRHSVTICLDSDLADGRTIAEAVMTKAESQLLAFHTEENQVAFAEAVDALVVAHAAALAESVEFIFRAIPRKRYDELLAMPIYWATNKQQTAFKAKCEAQSVRYKPLEWNEETFPPVLMAECCIEPVLTVEEATEIWTEWGDAEAAVIWNHAHSTQKMVK